jgi:hypothetical protein
MEEEAFRGSVAFYDACVNGLVAPHLVMDGRRGEPVSFGIHS